MTHYNTLNVKLSNSQFHKLKPATKNGTGVILNLLSNLIGNSNDETNFPHKLLLTDTKSSKLLQILQMVHQLTYNFQKSWHTYFWK